jgi:YjbR
MVAAYLVRRRQTPTLAAGVTVAGKKNSDSEYKKKLRPLALAQPDAEEGLACAGTALESSAFQARKKTFLFVGPGTVRLKLEASRAEAERLAKKEPGRYAIGKLGWVTIRFADGDAPPVAMFERWIAESYGLIVGTGAPKKKATAPKRRAKA